MGIQCNDFWTCSGFGHSNPDKLMVFTTRNARGPRYLFEVAAKHKGDTERLLLSAPRLKCPTAVVGTTLQGPQG